MNPQVPNFMPTVAQAGIRAFSAEWFSFNGINRTDVADAYSSLASFSKAPADEAWVYRCVSLKASFSQGTPLYVFVKDGKNRVPAEESSNNAAKDLQALLDDANPESMNGSDLRAYTTAALSVWGASYWRKVRGRLGGPPQELWWLRTPDVDPKMGRVWIDTYEYRDKDGTTTPYKPQDIVAFRRLNLMDPSKPLSPLSAARYDLSVDRNAAQWTAATLSNWGMPPTAWVIPKDTDFSKEDQSLVRRAIRALRGPRNANRTPILPQGLEPKVLSLNPKDAEWLAARKVSRMTVCAILGVPLVLAGDDEKASVYANMRDAERIFARAMVNELDWGADCLNGWLVPDFDPRPRAKRDIVIGFDYSAIEALQAPVEDRKRLALQELERRARTPDEYRAEFKVGEPLPDKQGEVLLQLSNLMPATEAMGLVEPEPEPAPSTPPPAPSGEQLPPGPVQPPQGVPGEKPQENAQETARHLYRHPAVRAWMDGTGTLDEVAALIGVRATDELAVGLRRRYTPRQLLEGVPEERYPGLPKESLV